MHYQTVGSLFLLLSSALNVKDHGVNGGNNKWGSCGWNERIPNNKGVCVFLPPFPSLLLSPSVFLCLLPPNWIFIHVMCMWVCVCWLPPIETPTHSTPTHTHHPPHHRSNKCSNQLNPCPISCCGPILLRAYHASALLPLARSPSLLAPHQTPPKYLCHLLHNKPWTSFVAA